LSFKLIELRVHSVIISFPRGIYECPPWPVPRGSATSKKSYSHASDFK